MARANRHFIPGYIWHRTHRCHKREFLLKFAKDRSRWVELLFEAKKRFRLSILNYVVTSNHIHLIASDNNDKNAIPKAMQYVAGRTGQEYNIRKGRKGAFWQDRYHATAIETGDHLWRCIVYVDLNMVRAGVVDHPSKWRWGGYHEIQNPKERYRMIDYDYLRALLWAETNEDLSQAHCRWVEIELKKRLVRQDHFSRAIAVGNESFVRKVTKKLGIRVKRIREHTDGFQLRETVSPYGVEKSDMLDPSGNLIPWREEYSLEPAFRP